MCCTAPSEVQGKGRRISASDSSAAERMRACDQARGTEGVPSEPHDAWLAIVGGLGCLQWTTSAGQTVAGWKGGRGWLLWRMRAPCSALDP